MKKFIVLFFLILMCGLEAQTVTVDNNNQLSGVLNADSVWTGSFVDLMSKNAASVSIFVYSDSASATNGLKIYFSPDKVTITDSLMYTIGVDSSAHILFTSYTRFYKIKYTNGNKTTHAIFIQPILRLQTSDIKIPNSIAVDTNVIKPSGGFMDVRDTWNWVRYDTSYSDTTSTAGDTVNSGNITEWWRITITADDTVYISSNSSYAYPANKVGAGYLLPGETWTSDKMNVAYISKFYYKQYGTGAAVVRIFYEGF